jgi:phospholipid/cholesterol/gamma-HCH transport system substrate-binding protein
MALSTEKKVGIFFLLSLVALGGLIELVEDWRPFQARNEYHTYFDSAVGIRRGDPVRMAGVEAGKVQEIRLAEGRVRVDFFVDDDIVIRRDSIAEIRQANLLGGQFLGLTIGSPDSPVLPPESTVRSRETTNIDELITSFDQGQQRVLAALGDLVEESRGPLIDALSQVEQVVAKVNEGEGTLGRIINDPRLYEDLQGTMSSMRSVMERLEKGDGTFARLLNDPALYDDAARMVASLGDVSERLRDGEGTIGRLLTDEELYMQLTGAVTSFREVMAGMQNGAGTFGRLLTDESLYDEIRSLAISINSIAGKIDRGEGTIGRLINEDDLYRDARTTLHKIEKTVDGMADTGPLSALGVVLGTLF